MLRLRTVTGATVPIAGGEFVEIADLNGDIAAVFAYDPKSNAIKAVTAGSTEAQKYSRLFGVAFSKIVKLPPELQ